MLLLLACTGEIPDDSPKGLKPGDRPPLDDTATETDAETDADSDADADADADSDTDADADPVETMCKRWNAARRNMAEATWSGSVAGCDPGDMDSAGRARALELLNTYRMIADQPEVDDDATKNATSQECALMMTANNELNHYPPSSWTCYSATGASGAGSSNIASGPAVMAMDMYMQDWGNDTTIGHRRWILSNQLGPIGIGSTSSYSCLNVIYGSGSSSKKWVAWPPEGSFPYDAVSAGGYYTLDQTGWTVQSDSIDVSNATVTVTEDGTEKAVTTASLLSGYGSTYAIKITPKSWSSRKGSTYHVALSGISKPIEYDVEMVDCDAY